MSEGTGFYSLGDLRCSYNTRNQAVSSAKRKALYHAREVSVVTPKGKVCATVGKEFARLSDAIEVLVAFVMLLKKSDDAQDLTETIIGILENDAFAYSQGLGEKICSAVDDARQVIRTAKEEQKGGDSDMAKKGGKSAMTSGGKGKCSDGCKSGGKCK